MHGYSKKPICIDFWLDAHDMLERKSWKAGCIIETFWLHLYNTVLVSVRLREKGSTFWTDRVIFMRRSLLNGKMVGGNVHLERPLLDNLVIE